ncbi:MAG: DNA-3-methyladenine glycosylase family protein [Bacillota bacterium]
MSFPITEDAITHLKKLDPIMKRLITSVDVPTEPTIDDPFHALVDTIMGQQISEHVKGILMDRLKEKAGEITPKALIKLGKKEMHLLGISKMKADTILRLAEMKDVIYALKDKDIQTVRRTLKSVKGVGEWTVEMFLFVCLQNPHVLSLNDKGIENAIKKLYDVEDNLDSFKEYFYPYESTAAAYLWKTLELDDKTIDAIKKG